MKFRTAVGIGLLISSVAVAAVVYHITTTKRFEGTYEDSACVYKKLTPVHHPQNHVLLFRNSHGGEFYTADKEFYDGLKEGDCLRYKYTEFFEMDSNGKLIPVSFEYKFFIPEKKKSVMVPSDV